MARRRSPWVLVALLACVAAYAAHEVWRYPTRVQAGSATPRAVTIPQGSGVRQIVDTLADAGVVERPLWFRLYVMQQGATRSLRAGQYRLPGDLTPAELLARMKLGPPARDVSVTVVPGNHSLEIAERLESAGVVSKRNFMAAVRSRRLRRKYGVGAPNLEGRLFPDTYRFFPGSSAERVIDVMVRRHAQVMGELKATHARQWRQLREKFGFGEDEVVTLASIVEKETGAASERPRIAGVFLNRLSSPDFRPRLLQTDPTIAYGCSVPLRKSEACRSFTGRIRTVHLRDRDNPYNTYTHEGLPPGPIASPSRAALEAVFAPEQHRYLFFVSKNDGTHVFSRTVREHERYVDRYQRRGAVARVQR